jgi:NADP-dependent 3-hydroxy acid dehydrogenase YdfG
MKSANNPDGLDTVFIIFSPQGGNNTLHDMDTGEIERTVDTMLKGCIYLSREIIKYFMKKRTGNIGMVLYEKGLEILPPLQAALSGAFRSLTDSLFQYYLNEPLKVCGFYSDSTSENNFADFIIKIMEDKDRRKGRWYNFSGKGGLFSFGRG